MLRGWGRRAGRAPPGWRYAPSPAVGDDRVELGAEQFLIRIDQFEERLLRLINAHCLDRFHHLCNCAGV
jgi:hypothetical protein